MAKSVPLSVRVTEDDAQFIDQVQLGEAETPSEKVRALLIEARKRHEGFRDYPNCLGMVQDMISPTLQRLRTAEHAEHVHSELVVELAQWIPEAMAFLLTSLNDERNSREDLEAFEEGVAERLFRLIENVLRMGVTRECRGYDPQVVARRLQPVTELVQVIRASREPGGPSS